MTVLKKNNKIKNAMLKQIFICEWLIKAVLL